MKKKDNVLEIFNDIMSDENYIDVILSNIKNVRTSMDLYAAIADKDRTFEDTMKLRDILEESRAIVKSIESF